MQEIWKDRVQGLGGRWGAGNPEGRSAGPGGAPTGLSPRRLSYSCPRARRLPRGGHFLGDGASHSWQSKARGQEAASHVCEGHEDAVSPLLCTCPLRNTSAHPPCGPPRAARLVLCTGTAGPSPGLCTPHALSSSFPEGKVETKGEQTVDIKTSFPQTLLCL